MITRRSLVVAMLAAPAIIRTPGLLMPVKAAILKPDKRLTVDYVRWVDQNNITYWTEFSSYSGGGLPEWCLRHMAEARRYDWITDIYDEQGRKIGGGAAYG